MSLIEKLGGYDACKYAHEKAVKENKDLITCGKEVLTTSEMDGALLEHRRQHNILEIGDKVVSDTGSNNLFDIIFIDGGFARLKSINFDHVYSLREFRHATPKEIAQGYRDE